MRFTLFLAIALPIFLPLLRAADKPRVFITDSNSWEISGGFAANGGSAAGSVKGGARPQTAEIMKTFGERCPDVVVTMKKENADFVVLLDHEGGKGYARRDNKVAVFDRDGNMIHSGSTRSLGNAVKDSCNAIAGRPLVTAEEVQKQTPTPMKDAAAQQTPSKPVSLPSSNGVSPAVETKQPATQPPTSLPSTSVPLQAEPATVIIKSTPDGAEITVDGKFVGSTPSTVRLAPGDHQIIVEKKGTTVKSFSGGEVSVPNYKIWKRALTVSSGNSITIDATLEKM